MLNKFIILFNTLKYLKPIQIRYRIYYFIIDRIGMKKIGNVLPIDVNANQLTFSSFIPSTISLTSKSEFCFLNQSFAFKEEIDWNFLGNGKLWTYNLNYFDFLLQQDNDHKTGNELILDYCYRISELKDGLEPYPISLRGINWIKFLSVNHISNPIIDACLYNQYSYLNKRPEYHLLGNHLLENGFSLLFASYYFRNDQFFKNAKKILISELDEQILADGAHFELSTMYHQIILYRLLDSINLVKNNSFWNHELFVFLRHKAALMSGWLKKVSWSDGAIPLLNDSAFGIAPSTIQLLEYASSLGIQPDVIVLKESGYRKIKGKNLELFFDIGKIGPNYQPGHAHADTFNFELYIGGKPVLVDTGTSTYERGSRRKFERSTAAHNTVEINGFNQSEIWASHRVGKRANVKLIVDNELECTAIHDGYKKLNILHQRSFKRISDSRIDIDDTIISGNSLYSAIARIHFHPLVSFTIQNELVKINDSTTLRFENAKEIIFQEYMYAPEFNKLVKSMCIEVRFNSTLKTIIEQ